MGLTKQQKDTQCNIKAACSDEDTNNNSSRASNQLNIFHVGVTSVATRIQIITPQELAIN
jgi:hypothetical protein